MKNKYEIRGDDTAIFISHKGNTFETLVDTSKLEELKKISCTWGFRNGYVLASLYSSGSHKTIRLHRIVTDCPEGLVVDHINHNTLDNREANLRNVTEQANRQNTKKKRNNSTGIRGITYKKQKSVYEVRLTLNGVTKHLGSYSDISTAEDILDRARAKFSPYSEEAFKLLDAEKLFEIMGSAKELPTSRNSTSSHRNVSWNRRIERWAASISHKGNRHFLGYYDDEYEAAKVVKKARIELLSGKTI